MALMASVESQILTTLSSDSGTSRTCDALEDISDAKPYRKWLKYIRTHNLPNKPKMTQIPKLERRSSDILDILHGNRASGTAFSSSASESSSIGVVSGVKSATVTVATGSILQAPSPGDHIARFLQHAHGLSHPQSSHSKVTLMDTSLNDRACARALQRRRILEEVIESEENYVADLKTLANVWTRQRYHISLILH